ncbi:hypothetical protein ABPG72_021263 [Tetrahymena utriculariae]
MEKCFCQNIYSEQILVEQGTQYKNKIQKKINEDQPQSIQKFQGNPKNQENFMLVKRQKVEAQDFLGWAEKAFDFVATLGNERYIDTYFELREDDGYKKIIQRTYINEVPAATIQSVWDQDDNLYEFDIIEVSKFKIKYASFLLDHPDCNQDQLLQQIQDEFREYYIKKNSTEFLNIAAQFSKLAAIGINSSKQVVFETFKVMNNALIKKGMKNFAVIGGRKMMQEGTKISLKVLGQKFLEGTVVEVTKQAGKRSSLTLATSQFALSGLAKGLFVGLAINTAVGYAKSYYMTGWEEEEIQIINVNNQFRFQNVQIFDTQYLNDYENLSKIYEKMKKNPGETTDDNNQSLDKSFEPGIQKQQQCLIKHLINILMKKSKFLNQIYKINL